MYAIPSKINLLSKIFSISDFPLVERYRVILSMHLSTRLKNNVATSSSGSWNTKAILFRLGLGFFFIMSADEKCGSERIWKVIYINTSPRHQACGIQYCSDYAWNNAWKNSPWLPKQVHICQVVTGLQKTNRKVHQIIPSWVGLFPVIF